MSENERADRTARVGRGNRGRRGRKRVCSFCVDKIDYIDYKDVNKLKKYITERGKILPRRISETVQAPGLTWQLSGPEILLCYHILQNKTKIRGAQAPLLSFSKYNIPFC